MHSYYEILASFLPQSITFELAMDLYSTDMPIHSQISNSDLIAVFLTDIRLDLIQVYQVLLIYPKETMLLPP